MTWNELQQRRRERWESWLDEARTSEAPAATLLRRAGLLPALELPGLPLGSLPTLAAGEADGAALRKQIEPRLGREAFELRLWPQPVYASRELLPPIYVWIGARTRASLKSASTLAREIDARLEREGAMTTSELRQTLGFQRTSDAAIEQAAWELARRLRVVLAGGDTDELRWQALSQAWPGLAEETAAISHATALSELLLPVLEQWLATTEAELERLLEPLAPAHMLRSTLRGLEAARRLRPAAVEGEPAWEWVEETALRERARINQA